MPTFRYEALTREHVPIHGTLAAADETELTAILARRGMRLVSSAELSLNHMLGVGNPILSRLHQLRIGESLREAFLSGLPAHEAVRAIAAEPFAHPFVSIFPWLQATAAAVFILAAGKWLLFDGTAGFPWIVGVFCCGVMPALWAAIGYIYSQRPRRLLHHFADQLESGNRDLSSLAGSLPAELRTILNSDIEDSRKVQAVSELMPTVLGSGVRNQQLAMNIVGPLLMLSIVLMGLHALLAFVVPDFRRIFEDFGTALPAMTVALIDLSRLFSAGGIEGWLAAAATIAAGLLLLFWLLTSGRVAETLEGVPWLGMGFRWNMQARVSRILAALVRNNCGYAESIRTATAGSGFLAVRVEGKVIADQLQKGSLKVLPSRMLNGLPISLLFTGQTASGGEDQRDAIAATFDNLADMLHNATAGQGRLFAMILHLFTLLFGAFCVGFGVVAMFLPLIKLLNDLA